MSPQLTLPVARAMAVCQEDVAMVSKERDMVQDTGELPQRSGDGTDKRGIKTVEAQPL